MREVDGVTGTAFARLGAERAVGQRRRRLQPLGRARCTRCASLGSSGIWELFVPELDDGRALQVRGPARRRLARLKADPYALATEAPPANASVVYRSQHEWDDDAWLEQPARRDEPLQAAPMSIYEVHLGSWRRNPLEGNRSLTYLELADELADYVERSRLHARRAAAGDGAPVLAAPGATR